VPTETTDGHRDRDANADGDRYIHRTATPIVTLTPVPTETPTVTVTATSTLTATTTATAIRSPSPSVTATPVRGVRAVTFRLLQADLDTVGVDARFVDQRGRGRKRRGESARRVPGAADGGTAH